MNRNEIIESLKKYKQANIAKYGILEMGIFGSVARNESSKKSDIDIFIKTITPNPFILVHIKEELENLYNVPVDLVRFRNNMNPYLSERIKHEGIYV